MCALNRLQRVTKATGHPAGGKWRPPTLDLLPPAVGDKLMTAMHDRGEPSGNPSPSSGASRIIRGRNICKRVRTRSFAGMSSRCLPSTLLPMGSYGRRGSGLGERIYLTDKVFPASSAFQVKSSTHPPTNSGSQMTFAASCRRTRSTVLCSHDTRYPGFGEGERTEMEPSCTTRIPTLPQVSPPQATYCGFAGSRHILHACPAQHRGLDTAIRGKRVASWKILRGKACWKWDTT